MVCECLNDPDRQAVFRALENKYVLTLRLALLLFPLKNFFDGRMPDDRDALIVVEEPLDHIGNGINVDLPVRVSLQWRALQITVACHFFTFKSNDAPISPTKSPRRFFIGKNAYFVTASSDSSRNTPSCRSASITTVGRARLSSPSSIFAAKPKPCGHSSDGLTPAV